MCIELRHDGAPPEAFCLQQPGAEFHLDSAHNGKAIAVFECASMGKTKQLVESIQQLPGVVNVSMIYHHAEENDALEENIA